MLTGPNLSAQESILGAVGAKVIASGGVSSREDVTDLIALRENYPNLDGVIVGKAIYEGRVTLTELLGIAAG
jgi:phosphoribosylformimino-5-aminoimidazole carboxamide ribonucleotide (ProFAR) isomerase